MNSATTEVQNDISHVSIEDLKQEYNRLQEMGLHKLALQVNAIIAKKRIVEFKESGEKPVTEKEIYDSFTKFTP